jgi:hypothetical protein
MRDFDEQRALRLAAERTFKINGRTFTHRPGIEPEVLAEFEGVEEMTGPDAIKVVDSVIVAFLDPGQEAEWEAARQPCENPITLPDMIDLVKWLTEATSNRPTEQPSASTPSDGTTQGSSTAVSSSPVRAVSAI